MPYKGGSFEVEFDFVAHALVIHTSEGATRTLALESKSVAAFYAEFMDALESLAPPMPQADKVTQEGYSHEVSSVGWWPGDAETPYPAF